MNLDKSMFKSDEELKNIVTKQAIIMYILSSIMGDKNMRYAVMLTSPLWTKVQHKEGYTLMNQYSFYRVTEAYRDTLRPNAGEKEFNRLADVVRDNLEESNKEREDFFGTAIAAFRDSVSLEAIKNMYLEDLNGVVPSDVEDVNEYYEYEKVCYTLYKWQLMNGISYEDMAHIVKAYEIWDYIYSEVKEMSRSEIDANLVLLMDRAIKLNGGECELDDKLTVNPKAYSLSDLAVGDGTYAVVERVFRLLMMYKTLENNQNDKWVGVQGRDLAKLLKETNVVNCIINHPAEILNNEVYESALRLIEQYIGLGLGNQNYHAPYLDAESIECALNQVESLYLKPEGIQKDDFGITCVPGQITCAVIAKMVRNGKSYSEAFIDVLGSKTYNMMECGDIDVVYDEMYSFIQCEIKGDYEEYRYLQYMYGGKNNERYSALS